MLEIVIKVCATIKNVFLYIPNKVISHFDKYYFFKKKYVEYQAVQKAYERRLACIRTITEENHYNNEDVYKRKIIELTSTPIKIRSIKI